MRKAFTIVELLVVMAVIGILITLAVVGIQAIQKSQRETTRLNDMRNIVSSLFEYYTSNRVYPPDISWLYIGTDGEEICIYDWPGGWATSDDRECRIDYKGTAFFNKVNLGQKGAVTSGQYFDGEEIASTVTAPGGDCEVPKSPDTWTIYYKTNFGGFSGTPQIYGLYFCSESGLSQNFGEVK